MTNCFIIQPFDGGKFDKRYQDTFEPAVRAASLNPYRVDHDPATSIPIESIEQGIKSSPIVFADITLDNPNVWFELGYAISSGRELCLVCSSERTGTFPFDIQHRSVIKYSTESQSDFAKLQTSITRRLVALVEKSNNLLEISALPLKPIMGLTQYEIIALCTIVENMQGLVGSCSYWKISNDMENMGLTRLAINITLKKLQDKSMIEYKIETDRDGDEYTLYTPSDRGVKWLIDNEDRLQLRKTQSKIDQKSVADDDDDIPF